MSYEDAQYCFQENISDLGPPGPDADKETVVLWNLNQGLLLLVQALQSDIQEMKKRLTSLEKLLKQG